MQYSGYSKIFQHELVNAALKACDEIHRKADCGYDWNRDERDKAKRNKVGSWYLKGGYESVIFVPSTPDSILQQRYQSEVNRQGLRIRVVEKHSTDVLISQFSLQQASALYARQYSYAEQARCSKHLALFQSLRIGVVNPDSKCIHTGCRKPLAFLCA